MTITEYRRMHKISSQGFAEMCGVSSVTISKIENGHCVPALQTFIKISEATDGAVTFADIPALQKQMI